VASATVAARLAHYFQDFFLLHTDCHTPFTNAPFDYDLSSGRYTDRTWFDLPAIGIAALVTIVLVKGIRESASLNTRSR